MNFRHRQIGVALALAVASTATLLSGCGGGGDGAPTTDDVSITVIDGAIENAVVCLDKNGNGACDVDEPTGRTDAAGKVTLKVDKADTGKFPVLVIAGTDAKDADTGRVPVAFTLKAPADKTALVSPLTTLVQTVIEGSGLSSTAAEIQVKDQAAVTFSLFADFSKGSSADQLAAGALARLIVVTTQQQTTALVSTIGTNAIDGSKITKEKLDEVIKKKLLERVKKLAEAIPAVLAATTPAAKEAAVTAQATVLVSGNELPPESIATVVAVNNQVPTGKTMTALEHAQSFIGLYSASIATSWPTTSGLGNAFVDACYLDNGNTKASSKAIFDLNPADSIAGNQFSVGSTRTNITVLADRSVTNADGSIRREIDVNYQVNYTDGTVAVDPSTVTTLISGSSSGSVMQPGVPCATPQSGSNWRFLGNRRIIDIQMRPWNYRTKTYSLATGASLPVGPASSPVNYTKAVQIVARDRNTFATYVVVSGPGLPSAGIKGVSPRLLRDDPLFAGKYGNYVDWKLYESFRYCRTSNGSFAAADVADCVQFGAASQFVGSFDTTAAVADSGFDALGFVAGGTYTYKVYNDDGWKTVNGQSSQTPIATYTTTLRALPYSAVTLAGTGVDSDLYPRFTSSSLSTVDIATAFRNKAAFTTDLTFTALGVLPDAAKFGFGDVFAYESGKANSTTSFWPASRQSTSVYPAAGALSVTNFNVPAPNSVLVTPNFGELGIEVTNRQRRWIGSYLDFR